MAKKKKSKKDKKSKKGKKKQQLRVWAAAVRLRTAAIQARAALTW